MKSVSKYYTVRNICLFLVFFMAGSSTCFAEYDYINISDPFLNKIPIAIPKLMAMSESSNASNRTKEATRLLSRSLAYTGYFKIIDEQAFLERPAEKGITAEAINFKNWTDIGTELLITGGLRLEGGVLQLEFRLFDPFRGELLLGKRYTGEASDLRKMVLKFCDDMVQRLTGKPGVFNSRIAFVSSEGGGKRTLFVCEFDGTGVRPVVGPEEILLFPSWSTDGKSLAYTSYKRGKPDIFVKPVGGGAERLLADFKGMNSTPVFMPDRPLIAATLSFEGDEEIYLLTESGEVDKRLTKSWGVDVAPTFSRDGEKMAFVSNRAGSPQIYIMDLKSGREHRLTFDGSYNTQPEWSPAGDRIVYSGMENGETNIYSIDADGGNRKQLTSNAGSNEAPSWSPDGNLIVFASTRNGTSDVFVMTASGTDQRPLLELPGKQSFPDWSPVRLE